MFKRFLKVSMSRRSTALFAARKTRFASMKLVWVKKRPFSDYRSSLLWKAKVSLYLAIASLSSVFTLNDKFLVQFFGLLQDRDESVAPDLIRKRLPLCTWPYAFCCTILFKYLVKCRLVLVVIFWKSVYCKLLRRFHSYCGYLPFFSCLMLSITL